MKSENSRFATVVPAIKISFSLILLCLSLLFTADMLGFIPNESRYELEGRKRISELVALQLTLLDSQTEQKKLRILMNHIVKRNEDVLSAGVRVARDELVYQTVGHNKYWGDYRSEKSTATNIIVPIYDDGQRWGQMELYFTPLKNQYFKNFDTLPVFKLSGFFLVFGSLAFFVFIFRIIRRLDPSNVVPGRVNAAFDTLSESVLIIDESEQIVLVNKAFTEKFGAEAIRLIGKKSSELNWVNSTSGSDNIIFPWQEVLETGKSNMGSHLFFRNENGEEFKFVSNCSPIMNDKESIVGVLVTLDDITALENRNVKLKSLVTDLRKSHTQIEKQNRELNYLATRDPLTGCLNRRSFNEGFKQTFESARKEGLELACIMVDIDHFKSVNDNFGHAVGDEVIKLLADILHENCRGSDLVGRYGGEEFCLVLPGAEIKNAIRIAEKIRLEIKNKSIEQFEQGLRVTVSLGVASIRNEPENELELNKFADEALYEAKENGRNRVVEWQYREERAISQEVTPAAPPPKPWNPKEQARKISDLESQVERLESTTLEYSYELDHSKTHDALTGLPNQILFVDRLKNMVQRAERFGNNVAVLIIDVSILDAVNSVLGREQGDLLLKGTAQKLDEIFREYDSKTLLNLSRFSGNEFAVHISDIDTQDSITWILQRFLQQMEAPFEINGHQIRLNCYVGVGVYPDDGKIVDDLINAAIVAKQYCKKKKSKKRYQFYDSSIQINAVRNMLLEKEIRDAVEKSEWLLHYQPKKDVKTGQFTGVEALIRWQHPTRGIVMPYEFIEFSEARGLIVDIGKWVIEESCRQLIRWRDQGIKDYSIAVNLSTMQLKQEGFVDELLMILESYEIPPRMIELEVTETALMTDLDVTLKNLKRLNLLGMNIAMDDFGTGYASLNYLKRLPISILKIDRSFIMDLDTDKKDEKIVKALVDLGHSMNMKIVAEGVENRDQYRLLEGMQCDMIQGYLLSKPVTAEEVTTFLLESETERLQQVV